MITLIFLILLLKGAVHIIKALVKLALVLLCLLIDAIFIIAIIGVISLLI